MMDSKVDVIFMKFSSQVDALNGNFACFYIELHHAPKVALTTTNSTS